MSWSRATCGILLKLLIIRSQQSGNGISATTVLRRRVPLYVLVELELDYAGERPTTGGSPTVLIDDPPELTQSFQPFITPTT